jgi:2-C-methyl-D-erythritol 4-phosphate cytidylyltransferase
MKTCSAILLAAGRSQRLGFDKILTPLLGKPVLLYALESVLASPWVEEVLIVTRADIVPDIRQLALTLHPTKSVRVVAGGAERQDSVYAGLLSVSETCTHVLIHDAARPLLSLSLIEKVLSASDQTGGAVAAHRATDTLKRVDGQGAIETTLDRSQIWMMETPQVFEKKLITESYKKVMEQQVAVTDDASTVELAGGQVLVVESDTLNLKITRPLDWQLLELWLQQTEGKSLRDDIHQLSNELSPLVGYLPLLEKYGGDEPKFLDYLKKSLDSVRLVQAILHSLQKRVRELFP